MNSKKAKVFYNHKLAGYLLKKNKKYFFQYSKDYLDDKKYPAISLTLLKRKEPYLSDYLFPFFYGLLAEGENKILQCRQLNIDENDHFTRLIKTAGNDTIGAVTIRETDETE